MKMQKLNQRQARQVLYLSRFNFTLKHVLEMEKVDSLSRRLDLKVGVENNNENQKLIKKEQIRGMNQVIVKGPEIILVEKIKRVREEDEKVIKLLNK